MDGIFHSFLLSILLTHTNGHWEEQTQRLYKYNNRLYKINQYNTITNPPIKFIFFILLYISTTLSADLFDNSLSFDGLYYQEETSLASTFIF